jgi:cytochrome P450
MQAGADTMLAIPAHVPRELVRDVDIYNVPGADSDVHLAWKKVQDDNPDVFFTPRYGGYWVVTRHHLLARIFPDHEGFSSHKAIGIPPLGPEVPPQIPIEIDPPQHHFFRAPINLALSPKKIQQYGDDARRLASELIEGFRARCECEFVAEFAAHLPMDIFLSMVDLPREDRNYLVHCAETMTRGGNEEERVHTVQEIFGYLDSWVRKRKEAPGADLISQIIQIKVGDRPITHEEILSECALVLFGGLDTVSSTMAFVARFLALNPAHRRELAANPETIPQAVEELVRRHTIPTVGRVLTRDQEVGGVAMKRGDRVMLNICFSSLDERAWPDPLKVDFNRNVHDHLGFGRGNHKCPGANLARRELKIFLEEWLVRIPEFSIKPGEQAETKSGNVSGVKVLPLVWTV